MDIQKLQAADPNDQTTLVYLLAHAVISRVFLSLVRLLAAAITCVALVDVYNRKGTILPLGLLLRGQCTLLLPPVCISKLATRVSGECAPPSDRQVVLSV